MRNTFAVYFQMIETFGYKKVKNSDVNRIILIRQAESRCSTPTDMTGEEEARKKDGLHKNRK